MNKITTGLLVSLFTLVATAERAHAAEPDADAPPAARSDGRVIGHAQLAGQVNPPGVMAQAGAFYRHAISEKAYVQAGAAMSATPAYVAPQAHVEWSPTPSIVLRGDYEMLAFTGNLRGMVSLPSAGADFDSDSLDRANAQTGMGHRLKLSPRFNAQLGPVTVVSRPTVAWYRYAGDGPYFYEVQNDTVIARGDFVIDSRTDVLFTPWHEGPDAKLMIGPSYRMTRAMRTEIQRQRLGGVVTFTPSTTLGPMMRPTFFLESGVNAEDANRAGQAYAAMGISAELP